MFYLKNFSKLIIFSFTVCAKTEVIKNTLNPNWKQQVLPIQVLCNGDRDRTIKIEVYDWNSNGSLVLFH